MDCIVVQSNAHKIFRKKLISVKYQLRRRCWTEICRKVDGGDEEKKSPYKEKEEDSPKYLYHPYTSTCFDLFLQ